ncbi:MAG: ParB/RepB/Spo0J family partition protein [Fermentimonas sp.]|jgi:ParB family chromosome partitioning protein|nr:ParB/RepB/Spo0J family partition protein [Fermentimonas sp.]MDD4009783.1 ParB/RepB/Spo0J family partition protein [Fermentimonas sp.]MDD4696417.1 ParB/RepB/Spo0J family partition protein [Fermentimonas sp.]
MAKKNALGRGLDALITFNDSDTQGSSSISEVDLHKIAPNPDQPRRTFDEEALQELAASIKSIGLVQPITLREIDEDSYEIIAGERRYRASLMAGLTAIPAYIKTVDDDEIMEMALIENIQREDLNSIEIALAYQKLINTLSLTQEQLSERVGKKRATVANYLRLLKLPAEVQMGVKDKKIDMGHARALVTMNDPVAQLSLYNIILQEGLSVRNVETIVRDFSDGKQIEDLLKSGNKSTKSDNKKPKQKLPDDFELLKKHLSSYFETDVQFSYNKNGKGRITIPFNSSDDLERIIVMFDKMK